MKSSGLFLVIAFVLSILFIGHYSDAIESDPSRVVMPTDNNNSSSDLGGTKMVPPDIGKGYEEKKAKDQDGGSREESKKEPKKDELKEIPNEGKARPSEDPKAQEENRKRSDGESDSKPLPLEDSSVEECDPSNRCIDRKSKIVACLRVPGKDSLDLSLLIQNKGTGSINVSIVAPEFVNLEQNTVTLEAKKNKPVKVTVGDGVKDTVIVLKVGEGNCSLDFENIISNSFKKSETSAFLRYLSLLATRSSSIYLFLAAAVLLGVAWLCIRFKREGGPTYQKLDVGLPVSTGGKKEADEANGWDDSWGDDWGDEEAPVTPSKPVMNPSSKGLAARRSTKDGWKD